ncbi:hypothetical protein [Sporolactobacillus laevolacticus]|uniref:Uncharacterized protein n=1 Tax=Sporolactobacillus laevolacticus DSM 442 TaxID=1395513 RepID=V6IVW4_9BACL|nr:hypothetical protein [Sporolactobacillus laevolacticus]EST11290.1 hypothetical protein P343_13035 [Sporolactobacillus laevolacticus DSM 442]
MFLKKCSIIVALIVFSDVLAPIANEAHAEAPTPNITNNNLTSSQTETQRIIELSKQNVTVKDNRFVLKDEQGLLNQVKFGIVSKEDYKGLLKALNKINTAAKKIPTLDLNTLKEQRSNNIQPQFFTDHKSGNHAEWHSTHVELWIAQDVVAMIMDIGVAAGGVLLCYYFPGLGVSLATAIGGIIIAYINHKVARHVYIDEKYSGSCLAFIWNY